MTNTTKQSFKGKSATIILTIVALVCTLILCPLECYYLPEFIRFFISAVLPVVLFLLFFTKLYQFNKSNIILAVFLLIWAILSHYICRFVEILDLIDYHIFEYTNLYGYYMLKTYAVLPLIIMIIGLFGIFKSKKIYVTLMSIALFLCIIPLFLVANICFSCGFNSYGISATLHLLFLCLEDIAILIYLANSEPIYIEKKQQTTSENELDIGGLINTGEKVLIKGNFGKINPLTVIFIFLSAVLVIPTVSTYLHATSGPIRTDWPDFLMYRNILLISILLLAISVFLTYKSEIIVTDKRVYGKAIFGKRVDLPFDKISSVSSSALKGIGVATSSGKITFLFCKNNSAVFNTISKVLLERQEKRSVTAPNIIQNQSQSDADELKKFKELLDSGVITQEEFDAKKKQLLGL